MDPLASRLAKVLHDRAGHLGERAVDRHALTDLEQSEAEAVPAVLLALEQALTAHLGREPEDGRLGQAAAPGQLHERETRRAGIEGLDDGERSAQDARGPAGDSAGGVSSLTFAVSCRSVERMH